MGKQDSIVGYSDFGDFLKNYPRASFVVLDNAGHNLQIEQPELFYCLTKEWLERVINSEKQQGVTLYTIQINIQMSILPMWLILAYKEGSSMFYYTD
jgi:hypothetical protein